MLCEKYDRKFLGDHLVPTALWKPFPKAESRNAWESMLKTQWKRKISLEILAEAQKASKSPCQELPASLYMDYMRTGNRSNYETPYFNRRSGLGFLVMAECIEHRGRYLDKIIDGIWQICEETTWCIPAHFPRTPAGNPLPTTGEDSIDLFAAETAMVLAQAVYLLESELDAVSPEIVKRVRMEMERRIFHIFESSAEKHWWTKGTNNWSPWCASNILGAVLFLMDDKSRMLDIVCSLMGIVDRFIANYKPDGACDEGPMYWTVAPGAMLSFLELLHSRSNGDISIYDEPLIARMGHYISDMHIAGSKFASFADSAPDIYGLCPEIFRYGERINDRHMMNLALHLSKSKKQRSLCGAALSLYLRAFCWMPAENRVQGWTKPPFAWYGDNQILVARETLKDGIDLVLAVKGGHNAENHNHNDVGQFIIYSGTDPVIIDFGAGEYRKETFGPNRYEIFFTRSLSHNVPLVNGFEQIPGENRKASNPVLIDKEGLTGLAIDIQDAYPKTAGLRKLRRELLLKRGEKPEISLTDSFSFQKTPSKVKLLFYSLLKISTANTNVLKFHCNGRAVYSQLPGNAKASVSRMNNTDPRLRSSWGNSVYRAEITFKFTKKQDSYTIKFNHHPKGV